MRFSHAEAPGGPVWRLGTLQTGEWSDLGAAAAHMLSGFGRGASSLIVCAAGPMAGRRLQLTNAAWAIDGPAIAAHLGLEQGLLLNDFEALALSLPVVGETDARRIGSPQGTVGTRIVLGPGTGMGLAALAETPAGLLVLPSEAGHIDFGPASDEEVRIWSYLDKTLGRVSAEWLLSGPGLERLHAARRAVAGLAPSGLDAAAIGAAARAAPDGPEAATLRQFWQLVARYAGDMALVLMARGGVTLAGGVLPKMADFLDEAAFRAAFEAKAPLQRLLRDMPVRLLTDDTVVERGMARIAASPQNYVIDYGARCWI
ncbi:MULTISPECIES: glucokinase [unclassified Beijerinckia]|uniref:glucokinase n=1 Tax=unclassified Beijerinckia TaxID=2638183 RepID=UPI001FCD75BB|nr:MULTISPECIES: glucokinase [unclassified Beijerinckia]